MPSLAARILDLHAQKFSREEIMRHTGCKPHYLRSVLSRASAPDEETRRRRTLAIPGSRHAKAQLACLGARKAAIARGESLAEARKCAREAYRNAMYPAPAKVTRKRPRRCTSKLQLKEARA